MFAALALGAFLAAASTSGAQDPSQPAVAARERLEVPSWREVSGTGRLESGTEVEGETSVRLRSRRGGRVALDQVIPAPTAPFTVLVRGRVLSGRAELALEWTDATGEELSSDVRELDLPDAPPEQFNPLPGADRLRVLVSQTEAKSVVELDAVELRSGGEQLLGNPELDLLGCPTNNAEPESPYAVTEVPGWQTTPDATFSVLGRAPSSPIVIRSEQPQARLSQDVGTLRRPFTIKVAGKPAPPGSALVLEWEKGDSPGSASLFEERRPLDLSTGEDVFAITPPPSALPLALEVGLEQVGTGPAVRTGLTVDRMELVSADGDQRLNNPAFDLPLCTPAPMRPTPASVAPAAVRWILTAAILIPLAFLFRWWILRWKGPRPARWVKPISGRARIAFLVAIALAPLVSVGTVKLGVRVVLADWIFLGLALFLLRSRRARFVAIRDRTRVAILIAAVAGLIVTLTSLTISQVSYTDLNFSALSSRSQLLEFSQDPLLRGLLDSFRLVQGLACLFVVLALVNTRERWIGAAKVFVLAGAGAAVYGAYQVASQEAFGTVLQPPGAFSNPGILRASGPFAEPQGLGGFLVVAAACAVALHELKPEWWVRAAAGVIVIGILLTQSSAAFAALAVLVLAIVLTMRVRAAALVLLPLLVLALATQFGVAAPRVDDAIRKPFGDSNSVIDREVSWTAAAEMGATYAPLGVGRGQFPYNQAPFEEPDDVGRNGRVGSAALEIWAEGGPVGFALALLILLAAPATLIAAALRGQAPGRSQVTIVVALTVGFAAVMVTYFSTTLVWPWIVVGLMAAAPQALRPRPEPTDEPPPE